MLPNSLGNHHVFNNLRLPKRGNIPDRAAEQIEHLLKHNRIVFLATAMKLKFKVSIVDMIILPRNNILQEEVMLERYMFHMNLKYDVSP